MGVVAPWRVESFWTRDQARVPGIGRWAPRRRTTGSLSCLDQCYPTLSALWAPLLCSVPSMLVAWKPFRGQVLAHFCVLSIFSLPFWDDSLILNVLPGWIYFYVIRRHYCSENSRCFTLRFSANVISDVASLPAPVFSALWKWSEVKVAQSCPTLCNSMDCSLPGFSVRGIL